MPFRLYNIYLQTTHDTAVAAVVATKLRVSLQGITKAKNDSGEIVLNEDQFLQFFNLAAGRSQIKQIYERFVRCKHRTLSSVTSQVLSA